MKIVVINGTEVKGSTYAMKEVFIAEVGAGNEIVEYYLPKDMPKFCRGCKICFINSESKCPHADYVLPIWNELMLADLIVFAYPVYGMRAPGQVKALLDHLCCHWLVHRPEEVMFNKRAMIITNSAGSSNRAAQKDVKTSLNWLGISSVDCIGVGLIEGVIWDKLSEKKKRNITKKVTAKAQKFKKYTKAYKPASKGIKVSFLFAFARMIQKGILKKEETADNMHWVKKGWIDYCGEMGE